MTEWLEWWNNRCFNESRQPASRFGLVGCLALMAQNVRSGWRRIKQCRPHRRQIGVFRSVARRQQR